jgi:hypothetical protein
MITEPKIEDRNEQPYVGIRAQVTMQELGKTLPPLWGEVYGWLASKGIKPAGAPVTLPDSCRCAGVQEPHSTVSRPGSINPASSSSKK